MKCGVESSNQQRVSNRMRSSFLPDSFPISVQFVSYHASMHNPQYIYSQFGARKHVNKLATDAILHIENSSTYVLYTILNNDKLPKECIRQKHVRSNTNPMTLLNKNTKQFRRNSKLNTYILFTYTLSS